MDIKLSCHVCNCEGFKLEMIQLDVVEEQIWLLGNCPRCNRFVRISLNETIRDALEEVEYGEEEIEETAEAG